MVIYLDTCTFNRPFDSQIRPNIKLETEAKIFIQDKIRSGELVLVWSYILGSYILERKFTFNLKKFLHLSY